MSAKTSETRMSPSPEVELEINEAVDLSLSLLRDSMGERISVPARRMPEAAFVGVELNTTMGSKFERKCWQIRWQQTYQVPRRLQMPS